MQVDGVVSADLAALRRVLTVVSGGYVMDGDALVAAAAFSGRPRQAFRCAVIIAIMYRSPFSAAAPPRQARTGPDPGRMAFARQAGCVRRRAWLLGGSLLLLAAPLTLSAPAAHWAGDPELFRLLRGMAAIKGLLAVLAFAAVWWRLGRDLTPRLAAAYVGGVWSLGFAAGLIWQLTAVPFASGLFHCATILLLVLAWRDAGPAFERRRHVPDGLDKSA